ncbi:MULTISPECIES: queuosine precursor transporter [unclassified Oceanispirochaeta]|uniref:queuosine precursor transporter n=1 Tax=unclassified Oceanispirochaeta TaxID=2635722 RepID=UPI000E09D261|nr:MULTISPECIES: queuosine precursor transporter [unclassified Oceanispirochaeta]MBF9018596.1 queuosine precursor transporter [Oceanispirochaeta sp. M2]NPD75045.1 queuosine precursor transporter [Oceanispirochaeta sp. M1]RDG29117.1 VUT family protein [Oceanispirochaeta sp. M1]
MNELLWFAMMMANFLFILLFYRLFGKTGLFIWIPIAAIIANIQVLKLVDLFGINATLGNIVYASSFLVTDILSENYGKKTATKAVFVGFLSLIASMVLFQAALWFTPSADDWAQEALKNIFGLMPRIVLASLLAFGISQLHDVWAYNFWKRKWPADRFIWIRNNASTMVSQLIDSVVFTAVAFAGQLPMNVLIQIFISTYVLKWLVAAMDTPFIYLAVRMYKSGKIPEEI